jgi:hypothetical protein
MREPYTTKQIALLAQHYRDTRMALQRKADARLRPSKPQAPCDHGLFSDESKQLDLVDMTRRILTPRE